MGALWHHPLRTSFTPEFPLARGLWTKGRRDGVVAEF